MVSLIKSKLWDSRTYKENEVALMWHHFPLKCCCFQFNNVHPKFKNPFFKLGFNVESKDKVP